MTSKKLGLLAVFIAASVLWAIPTASSGRVTLDKAEEALRDVTSGVSQALDETLARTDAALRKTGQKAGAALDSTASRAEKRAPTSEPATTPPLHGNNPHAQGSVAVVDTNPSNERPLAYSSDGQASQEDVIVGRARGEQVDGVYRGHITIVALFGQELGGVDTGPGETKNGPLQPLQTSVLDPLCGNTGGQVCLSVLTADSTTTATGSDNDFAVARAGLLGLGVGAAESHGTIGQDANCQAAAGTAKTANVTSASTAVASAANSSSTSKSCRGAAPEVSNTSSVIGLGGIQVPLPAAGCANGTPDTVTGIPAVLPIVCNADDIAGAAAVREALDVFVLQVGGTSLAKETTAAAETFTVAPAAERSAAQCSDNVDNDGDGVIDARDPGCHSDNDANNPDSYNPNDNDETDRRTSGSGDDADDPQCSDGRDNDGDGVIDSRDPGCHTDGNADNPDSFDPDDDSEAGGGGDDGAGAPTGGQTADADTLPFTGTDVVGLALAGLLMLAGGLLLRRREGSHAAA